MRFLQSFVFAGVAFAALLTGEGCAYNATGTSPPKVLIFEYSLEGEAFRQSPNWAYYFVLDTNGNPDDGPLINGPAPLQFPYPDPRSYLPFVRDEKAILDRQTVSVPNTSWSTYFALYEENGQFVVWQGRPNSDGTINERVRPLQKGREWGFKDPKTLQLTLPFTLIRDENYDDEKGDPATWQANLCVALRGAGNNTNSFVIDRWGQGGQAVNYYFDIQTRPINQTLYDSIPTIPFPQNMPGGLGTPEFNITTLSYRVVSETQ